MAEILLISCNLACEPYPVYPLGMAMVAQAARDRGHNVRLWDPLAQGAPLEEAGELAARLRPDVIGLSLRNIDNTNAADLVEFGDRWPNLVKIIKERCAAPIVLGGAAFSLFPEPLLQRLGADYGVAGEGEPAFCDLVDRLAAGAPPQEKILRSTAPLPGAAIVAPRRDDSLAQHYLRAGGMLNLQTKRGCPHRCAYCSYPLLEGSLYRSRPAPAVADEIEMLRQKHGADYLAVTDSVFNDRDGHWLAVAEELVRRNIRIPWMAFLRPQRFRAEEVDLLRRAGLACVEWGTDGATDRTLAALGKSFTWAEVAESNRMFHAAGIAGSHFVIFGGPDEDETTLNEGLRNIERLEGCVVLAYGGIRILPGTAIQQRAAAEGMLEPGDDLLEAKFYFSPGIDRERLDGALRRSFAGRMDRIYPPGRDQEKVEVFHRLGYRGPIWDLLLNKNRTRSGQSVG